MDGAAPGMQRLAMQWVAKTAAERRVAAVPGEMCGQRGRRLSGAVGGSSRGEGGRREEDGGSKIGAVGNKLIMWIMP